MCLLLLPIQDIRPASAHSEYGRVRLLFEQGYLEASQRESENLKKHFQQTDPEWSEKFLLLEAESMLFRGMYRDALQLLRSAEPIANDLGESVHRLTIGAVALGRLQHLTEAHRDLVRAHELCDISQSVTCGDVSRARGILEVQEGQMESARRSFLETLAFARAHNDRWLESSASLNLGVVAMQSDHFDEALSWSRIANRDAKALGAKDQEQLSLGNLGWAFHQLGDNERALEIFLQAEDSAQKLGSLRDELLWFSTAGYVYRDTGDLIRATESYRRAYGLAKQLDSKEDIINALEDLAQVSVDSGKLEEANGYLNQVAPMEMAGSKRLSANVLLTQGMLAAARHQDAQAELLFSQVRADTTSPTTTRLTAGYQLARLFESEDKNPAAEKIYKATLNEFDAAQAQLKNEESKLPFVANATRIYDDYIQLLVRQGRGEEALLLADQSRARTLAQALGTSEAKGHHLAAPVSPRQISARTGATLLFYWLGQKQSYLWAVTPAKVTLFPLAPQVEIREQVEHYNKFIQNLHDPLRNGDADGQALYQMLVAPAAPSIHRDAPVMILADGALNQLNFETLLAPGAGRPLAGRSGVAPQVHYLLEDVTLLCAPSLAMLAATKPVHDADKSLLLLGNPVSPSEDFPSLPLFGLEMARIKKHFNAQRVSAFDGSRATPAAYLSSNPAHYAYIHFVSHAVASRTDPLDSAIILSSSQAGEDSFKLYARDIMQQPIDARLVTISACYGSGTRSYAGEGLVGLSWAFLRAGARSVIGALWEVSDDSTPQMMDTLYAGLEKGEAPAVALREAKLALIQSQDRFRLPFYWAPFQIYTTK